MPFFGDARQNAAFFSEWDITLESHPEAPDSESPDVSITIRHLPFLIGRVPGTGGGHRVAADSLLLDDPRPHHVSRDHCRIERAGHGVIIVRDCESTLGTQVNGKRIGLHHPSDSAPLREGDNEVLLGGAHSPQRFVIRVTRRRSAPGTG